MQRASRTLGEARDAYKAAVIELARARDALAAASRTRDSAAWKHARNLARSRDGGCTQRHQGDCDGRLEVHHVRPLEAGGTNALSNLQTLCRRHHSQAEGNFQSDWPPSLARSSRKKRRNTLEDAEHRLNAAGAAVTRTRAAEALEARQRAHIEALRAQAREWRVRSDRPR